MSERSLIPFEHFQIARHLARWTVLSIPVAIVTGSVVALFLWLLDVVTGFRWSHEWLLYLLPLAGVVIYYLYKWSGKNADAGNNLIMEEIHEPGAGVPLRMAPLVLFTTIVTHLFGGSAGREGTAVQMGGSIAQGFARLYKLKKADIRIMLMCGVAAGFGAVFGTPIAGAIFALEVLAIGRIRYHALLPCFVASLIGHFVCVAWSIEHTDYHALITWTASGNTYFIDVLLLLKVALAGVIFGLISYLFAETSHFIKAASKRLIPSPMLIPVIGGALVILLTLLVGTDDYLGLGVTSQHENGVSIVSAFRENGAHPWSWLLKLIFTTITLGMGFRGGEVTPLFFIGATLGNTLAVLLGGPVDLFAAIGFVAVFAGATNTPLACTLMAVELFGGGPALYFATACFLAYYFSGHTGIYQSQLVSVKKHSDKHEDEEYFLRKHKEREKGNTRNSK